MRRRDLLLRLGGALLAWPFAGFAQTRAMPIIGVLEPGTADNRAQLMEAMRQSLRDGGYVDGKDVAIALPASYAFREFPVAGGLMSYGSSLADSYRQTGLYAARILKGARPADLPVIQAAKLEFVLNANTAKKLGLSLSRDLLTRIDELIQ
jgi:ABC transporter substrate binding protein